MYSHNSRGTQALDHKNQKFVDLETFFINVIRGNLIASKRWYNFNISKRLMQSSHHIYYSISLDAAAATGSAGCIDIEFNHNLFYFQLMMKLNVQTTWANR